MLTRNPDITEDVHKVFMQITGAGQVGEFKKILAAPNNLHAAMLSKVERETAHAEAGQPARIAARMNSLIEPKMIRALYRASQAGVKVDLIVRGMCSLRPGIPGVSENIRLRSVLGRFLEHSRVFYFHNNGEPEMYLGSADWMPRNFFRRVEVVFPIECPAQRGIILEESIESYLKENQLAWDAQPDGSYQRITASAAEPAFSAQNALISALT